MKYRELAKTGLDVSVLAFGGSSLGSAFRPIDENEGIRAVRVALDSGINLIDTSPFYGLTKAETVLGKALRDVSRESYYLATKVGRYGYKMKDFDFSAARVAASVDESLQRLGVEYVDFIQAHDIEFGSVEQIINETIPALRKLQAEGKVRFVGITALPLKLIRTVMQRVELDQIQSYCHYCLNDTTLNDLLPYLESKGVGIFSSAPLAMRLLSLEGPPHWHPAPPELRARCAQAAHLCQARGSDIGKLALQFAVNNLRIHTTIVGTANPQRVLENIRYIEEPIDQDLLAAVIETFKPVHNLTWSSGCPENN